jgi:hypothetical protein
MLPLAAPSNRSFHQTIQVRCGADLPYNRSWRPKPILSCSKGVPSFLSDLMYIKGFLARIPAKPELGK